MGSKEDEEAQRICGCRVSSVVQTGELLGRGDLGAGRKESGDREEARASIILSPAGRKGRGRRGGEGRAWGAHSLQKTYSV